MNGDTGVRPKVRHLAAVRSNEGQYLVAVPRNGRRSDVRFTNGCHRCQVRERAVTQTVRTHVIESGHDAFQRAEPAAPYIRRRRALVGSMRMNAVSGLFSGPPGAKADRS